ncbi:hypothetical protein HFO41_35320 [Rhizobium leguminosarum]|uniref:hypothetical protein n=1 Tax=Rhizobium leguminosarum TaxID=384 RepID=UPI001C95A032|nr:hypothetical protein [Rhizobium leguminosarum]MBY5338580.1 hypothetical protein [Rhizobium leguminosarum]MBY5565607.1 hypothetical protein [Rhizobium leguminosarum]MBY5626488.1 hypothetical protein [Rhizobium leguminosarum]MBY5694002.1 hypothetical protein [Rhizobium leguminosarum]MBY5728534.1 hypothetical protein [Rhizobium leguminosarum]
MSASLTRPKFVCFGKWLSGLDRAFAQATLIVLTPEAKELRTLAGMANAAAAPPAMLAVTRRDRAV